MDTGFTSAVHLLVLLGEPWGRGLRAEAMARSVGTHPVRVRRILARLAAAGLTQTFRGRQGGTFLMRPLRDITLADVYNAMYDDPVLIPLHPRPSPRCPVGRQIGVALLAPLAYVDALVLEELQRRTVQSIAAAVHPGNRPVVPSPTPRGRRPRRR